MITARASEAQLARLGRGDRVVALPEGPASATVERVADLATALRRNPGVERLSVVGAGLTPRDREAARGLSLEFDAAPLARGVVELWSPRRVPAGSSWRVAGMVNDLPGGASRLVQQADGYVTTTKSGVRTFVEGEDTGARPGAHCLEHEHEQLSSSWRHRTRH